MITVGPMIRRKRLNRRDTDIRARKQSRRNRQQQKNRQRKYRARRRAKLERYEESRYAADEDSIGHPGPSA